MKWIMRHATQEWNGGVSIGGKKISNLRYADDTVLLAKSEMEMANLLELVEKFSNEAGLKLNRSKCSIITVDRTRTLPLTFNLIPDIDRKDSVIYLGALLSNKGGSEEEIKRRVGMAKTAIAKLVKIWKDQERNKVISNENTDIPYYDIWFRIMDPKFIVSTKNRSI